MPVQHRSVPRFRPSLPFILMAVLLGALWVAGGASRADALGQVVVRSVAWATLVAMILFGERPSFVQARPVALLLLAALALALLQLIPLPPDIWQALPGRAPFAEAAAASGQAQPWRPLSIVPGATVNAASSLIVPFTVLALAASLNERDRLWLPGLVLGLIAASTFIGLLQFSGARVDNPLINDIAGQVDGIFANRNHFALFLALGCLLAPVWAFLGGRGPGWRGPLAFGLVLLFALTILATGSRAGIVLGALALALGLAMTWDGIRRALARYPRWVFPALVIGMAGAVAIFVLLSIVAGRAASIDRAFTVGRDMRSRGLPTVLDMIATYFPVGSGLGGFDPVFRMHEPFALLKLTYFNHAHNDLLEIVLDAGLPGLLLLVAGLTWWGWASVRAWRAGFSTRLALPKLGSAMLLLLVVASAFDYPARTPMMMAMIILAGTWLDGRTGERGGSALPKIDQHL